jgi:hypothetical protein
MNSKEHPFASVTCNWLPQFASRVFRVLIAAPVGHFFAFFWEVRGGVNFLISGFAFERGTATSHKQIIAIHILSEPGGILISESRYTALSHWQASYLPSRL